MADHDLDTFMPLLQANGAIVLEGVAGIGKTNSIKKVRECLSHQFDLDALKELLDEVIRQNQPTPDGNDLPRALADAQKAKKTSICSRAPAKVTILVMHPSTSYEEMIGGLRPSPSTAGGTTFTWQPGKLTRAIVEACKDLSPDSTCRNHLIVLDEINRCNLPSVLGELIYLIEPSRRVTADILDKSKVSPDERAAFREAYSIPLGPNGRNGDLFIPSNLFFLGTMNSSDRSILGFDQALRRRFPPYRLEPMKQNDLVKALTEENGAKALATDLVKAVNAWVALNVFLRFAIGPDAMIGHSYWFEALRNGGQEKACDQAWRFGVLPQAIHAAESARKEAFLGDLFNAAKAAKAVTPPKKIEDQKAVKSFIEKYVTSRESPESAWNESSKACGVTEAWDQALLQIGAMKCTVRVVGSGHGEKLLVTED